MDGHTEISKMNLEGFRKPSTHILEIGIGHERSSVALQPGHLHINSLGGPGPECCETVKLVRRCSEGDHIGSCVKLQAGIIIDRLQA